MKMEREQKIKPRMIVANWKMNPDNLSDARRLAAGARRAAGRARRGAEVVLCPPAIYLGALVRPTAGRRRPPLSFGIQDIFWETSGAYTGMISSLMAQSLGVEYAIVGHSERRAAGDDDAAVNRKVRAARRAGLRVILCVGERERDERGHYLHFIRRQLETALQSLPRPQLAEIIIAYEPLWAISTAGRGADTPADFLEQAIYIRKVLSHLMGPAGRSVSVLYGGSVDEKNAAAFLHQGEADGLLVGRVSLRADRLAAIIAVA